MKDLAKKMFLGVRNLPQYPFGEASDAAASEAKEAADANQADLDPLNKLIKSSETLVCRYDYELVSRSWTLLLMKCDALLLGSSHSHWRGR